MLLSEFWSIDVVRLWMEAWGGGVQISILAERCTKVEVFGIIR